MSRVRFRVVGLILLMLAGVGGPTHAQALSDTLTFEQATALLRQHNPQLRAARARGQAQERAAEADALYPNPTVSVEEERTNLPNGVDDQWYASIRQPLRYPGEQGARARSAGATQEATGAMVEEKRTRLYNELRHRYLDVVGAQARVDLLRSFSEAIQEAASAAQVRYEEGDLGTFRRARLKVAQAQYENEGAEAEHLRALEVPGASFSRVDGFGLEADTEGETSYGPQVSLYADMVKLEVVCPDHRVEQLGEAIADEAQTGRRGDGKVYVLPVERGLDIRTQTWMEEVPATDETE